MREIIFRGKVEEGKACAFCRETEPRDWESFEVYETVSYLVLRRYGERTVPVARLGESYFFTIAEAKAALQERKEAAENGA